MRNITEHMSETCRSYALGYDMGNKVINEDTAASMIARNGETVSIEKDVSGTYTIFDLTEEQVIKVIDAI